MPQRVGLGGTVPWRLPGLTALSIATGIGLIGALGFLSQVNYAEKIAVSGKVQPLRKPVVVVTPEAGTVVDVWVADGERVAQGARLFSLNQALHDLGGQSANRRTAASLQARLRNLRATEAEYVKTQALEKELLQGHLAATEEKQSSARNQIDMLKRQLELARRQLRKAQRLARDGWLSEQDLDQSQQQYFRAEEALLLARRAADALGGDARGLGTRIALQQQKSLLRQAEYAMQAQQLEQQLVAVQRDDFQLVKAPVSGKVDDLRVQTGERIEAGRPALTLVQQSNDAHQVLLLLPSTAAGRVTADLPVRLRFSGYPYQRFGAGAGVIRQVSSVADTSQPIYRAWVDVQVLPDGVTTLPAGMLVDADIVLQAQPLWQWLLQPMLAAWHRL
ncbi:MAG: HlyD family secretion protein [bacterium]